MSSLCTAALFEIAKDWKQSKCPPKGDRLDKPGHMHEMEQYRDVKMNIASLVSVDVE